MAAMAVLPLATLQRNDGPAAATQRWRCSIAQRWCCYNATMVELVAQGWWSLVWC